ncbi:type 2 isopentenyl-diphosphate Delta-isomerase [Periweissella cryptocerci]|uniref:Isopentenyl-diphosphate delta-isomerase n=1 Tax=Periweissella cryptocerci TaxID=2506420 RepID=A0A4P6YRL8_9LACO|nr:type 2 isopentenyl-diphosphate Delta-isomerase [Periweissella cryptocerci]QBO35298.1 type 2 isopentenyl-diphosphate Delta-isomerase [Periweissella cryptocerci]
MESAHAHRKDEHLTIAEVQMRKNGLVENFNDIRLIHNGLPELAVNEVSIATTLPDFKLDTPFYIEAMTGGSEKTGKINQQLAQVAKETGIAMAVGSESIALKDPAARASFEVVRQENPDGFILANIGAGHPAQHAQQVIDLIGANALEVHINTAQEIVMPEGDRNFHWLESIADIVANVNVPVIVKEVGFGMSQTTLQMLNEIGVKYVNVGGRGGTNFAAIENQRNHNEDYSYLLDWGQTTTESLLEARLADTPLNILATGGIQNPLDILKAQVLGAKMVGVAGHFLHTLLNDKQDGLLNEIIIWQKQLHELYALVGAANENELADVDYVMSAELESFARQRM